MNNLSILIYLAEVFGTLKRVSGLIAVLLLVGYGLTTLVRLTIHADNRDEYHKRNNPEAYKRAQDFFEKEKYLPHRHLAALFVALVLTAVVTPSSRTLYLIAGSELGEQVIASDEARAIYDDVRAVLRSYARGEAE